MLETRYPTELSDIQNLKLSWRYTRFLIKQILTEKLSVGRSQFTAGSKITKDLGVDSLDLVEIAITLEKTVGIRVNEKVPFNYVLEIVDYLHFVRTWEE